MKVCKLGADTRDGGVEEGSRAGSCFRSPTQISDLTEINESPLPEGVGVERELRS